MTDTRITIVGTALTRPEKKVLEKSGAVVANFRVIANSRRQDENGNWYDAGNFRIRVNCWRRLADHVVASVNVGDPIVVHGRIFTREWTTEHGETRVNYEVEADSVGHDLKKGVDTFTKMRYDVPSSVVEDEESESRINGELAHALGYDDTYPSSVPPETAEDALAILRNAGLDAGLGAGIDTGVVAGIDAGPGAGDDLVGDDLVTDDPDSDDEEELVGAASGSGGPAGRGRRRAK